jgi:hypothetical protein
VAAGDFHLHIVAKDLIGHTSIERDISFHMGGVVVAPTEGLAVQDFQFTRKEDDVEPLDVPAYAAGDTIYVRFTVTGFRLGTGNQYHLSYGLQVTRPDGKPFLTQENAAQLEDRSFYPVMYIPSNFDITTTRSAAHGSYVVLLTVRDLIGSKTYQLKRTFTIE